MAQAIAQDMDFGNCCFADEGWSVAYWQSEISRLVVGDLYQDIMAHKMIQYSVGCFFSLVVFAMTYLQHNNKIGRL
jgi:hypothetical protein